MVYYTKFSRPNRFLEKTGVWLRRYRIFIIAFFLISASAYLWQINALSTRGFKIKELENNISDLKKDNQTLELEVTNEQSMFNLNERIKQLNLVAIQKVEYLQPIGPAVAVR